MVKSQYIGDGHPTFNRNPYNGYINPYGLGLMSLSPIWKSWELIDPIALPTIHPPRVLLQRTTLEWLHVQLPEWSR